MSIKLIAVDIDGTLVNSQKEITPEVFSAIQDAKEAGVKVVIATGRPIAGVAKLLDDLQLRDQGDYVVTFNGALVQETATGHEIISESLTYEDYLIWNSSVASSVSTCMPLPRTVSILQIAISENTLYTNQPSSACLSSTVPLKKWLAKKLLNVCLSMNQKFDAAIEKIPAEFYERYSINKSAPFYLELLKRM